jgi:hypothetical protein
MGLLDNGLMGISRQAKELGKPQEAAQEESYRNPLGTADFDSFGADLQQGEYVELANQVIPAGIERRWGYGSADQPENQGYAYGVFQNSSGEQVHVKLSFEWRNSTGRETQVVEEADSRDMDTADRYDRDTQPPMPERTDKNRATQDEEMVVKAKGLTDPGTITNNYGIDGGSSETRLPTTEYDVSA